MTVYTETCKNATTVAYAFYVHNFKNATIVAYAGLRVKFSLSCIAFMKLQVHHLDWSTCKHKNISSKQNAHVEC